MKNIPIIIVCSAILLGGTVTPGAADAKRGEQIARRWCADCHVVAPNERRPTSEAPPFATIANQRDFNAERLAFFLLSPHPKMPNMSLTRAEAIDLALYIASLRK
jgi:mono/diheme cytochrome c family protein